MNCTWVYHGGASADVALTVGVGVCAHDEESDPMSYTLVLKCGCVAYVACHPKTGIAHKRVIEMRGASCATRSHRRGERLWLWEMLPDPCHAVTPEFVNYDAGPMSTP